MLRALGFGLDLQGVVLRLADVVVVAYDPEGRIGLGEGCSPRTTSQRITRNHPARRRRVHIQVQTVHQDV